MTPALRVEARGMLAGQHRLLARSRPGHHVAVANPTPVRLARGDVVLLAGSARAGLLQLRADPRNASAPWIAEPVPGPRGVVGPGPGVVRARSE